MNARLATLLGAGLLLVGAVLFFKWGTGGTAALWSVSDQGAWLLPLVLVAALLDSVNPCAFSILLLTVAFLFSLGKLRASVLEVGAAYILGVFVVYMLIGLGLLQTLHIFQTPHFMAKLGALLLVGLGLINVTNHFVPAFPIKLRIPAAAHHRMATLMEKASLPSAFALGGLVGVCEFPCTGGPYLMVIGLLYDRATYGVGLGYLFLYNVIFVLPLSIILLIASDRALLARVEQWRSHNTGAMRLWGGNAMVLLGLVIFAL
ncbi:MAG TPA: cytochrome c biogenesis protein CcdA [Burkholderiaceae bacterium]|nr:cytochrome c biogenesis protein CcdA [Burkholderiaceae bacterium]